LGPNRLELGFALLGIFYFQVKNNSEKVYISIQAVKNTPKAPEIRRKFLETFEI
jgi:hypothetical protein